MHPPPLSLAACPSTLQRNPQDPREATNDELSQRVWYVSPNVFGMCLSLCLRRSRDFESDQE